MNLILQLTKKVTVMFFAYKQKTTFIRFFPKEEKRECPSVNC